MTYGIVLLIVQLDAWVLFFFVSLLSVIAVVGAGDVKVAIVQLGLYMMRMGWQ